MRAWTVSALGTLCLLLAAPARGQSTVDFWIEGRYVPDYDKTWDHIIRSGPGAGLAVGVDFSRVLVWRWRRTGLTITHRSTKRYFRVPSVVSGASKRSATARLA
jgi:hypothetical protein